MPLIEVLVNKQALIDRATKLVMESSEAAIASTQGRFTIALAGGNTPKPLYEALATQKLPWEQIQVFWGDERYVPPNHPDSNQRMARQAWLDLVPIPQANIHPMPTAANDPFLDAQNYEQELRQFFQVSESALPTFDLILLGMGDDGHTASLFPHTDALKVSDRLVTVGNKENQPRLTFTVPLINQARRVVFLVSGSSKRPALAEIFAHKASGVDYPARLIQPQGELWWLLDQDAGAELKV